MKNENNFMEKIFNLPYIYMLKVKVISAFFNFFKVLWWKNYFDSISLLHQNVTSGKVLKVFEIGSGSGFIYETMKNNNIKVDYYGTDLNKNMIDYCSDKFDNATWYHIDKLPYDFADNTFDIVIIWYVLHHVDTDENVKHILSEASRVGRKVILAESVQSYNYPLRILKSFYWKITDGGRYYYNIKELKNILSNINCQANVISCI